LASFTSPRVHAVLFTVFAVLYVICQSLFATVHPLF
jgi:hypothetical protein